MSIKDKSQKNYFLHVKDAIEDLIKSGSTGGEILGMVAKYLLNLEAKEPRVYEVIKEDIQDYLKYCQSKGINIT